MRLLYISYFYPPLGGPASLRNVKTVKYLAESGIACDVITVGDLEYLYRDASLLEECRADRVIRTASLDPMTLLRKAGKSKPGNISPLYLKTPEKLKLWTRRLYPIDNKIGWLPFLLAAGRKALKERDYDLIYISLGPFSSGLGAYYLSRGSGVPYALDLRDYWNLLSDYDLQGSGLNKAFSRHWEAKLYRHASLLVTATRGIGEDICAAFGVDLADKTFTCYNGWDEEDFTGLPRAEKEPGFELAYFGAIYARRSLKHFYRAVKRLREERQLPPGTRIRLYGNYFRETLEEIGASGIADLVGIVPQKEHRDALAVMLNADVLLLNLNSSGPRGTLSSKIFEYLRCQKPILAMVPAHNEAADLLRQNGQDHICAMESADSIYHCLKRLLGSESWAYGIPWELERRRQIGKLAARLKSKQPTR